MTFLRGEDIYLYILIQRYMKAYRLQVEISIAEGDRGRDRGRRNGAGNGYSFTLRGEYNSARIHWQRHDQANSL
jgi:hypothetical protein